MVDTHPRGTLTLYKAQIRQSLRLVADEEDQHQPASGTLLEHRHDVSALVVCHKAQVQRVSHCDPLRLLPHTTQRCTRAAASSDK
ncbi:hypothetical protein E2C01_013834 [Portunus trituberculatus]|uniref:Uncharacterized protein n=1 Tax=Portunus trituberculatus TaxID=210409 RepID=A0A5B7DIF0_PORTR|nr:hypothetical protein [Portunus trituberculatus]